MLKFPSNSFYFCFYRLEGNLTSSLDDSDHRGTMSTIRNLHDSLVSSLEGVQSNTAQVLQQQEKDLMRSFKARLTDVSGELDSLQASANEAGTGL